VKEDILKTRSAGVDQVPEGSQRRLVFDFGPFRMDAEEEVLLRDGHPIPLTHKAFETLRFLVLNRGRVLEKERLMSAIWPDSFVEEATLAQNIFTLRRILGEKPNQPIYIETVPRRGYRFVAHVIETFTSDVPFTGGLDSTGLKSIAILPFGMLSPDVTYEYIGTAMADALITKLSNIRKVIVRPTSAVLKYGNLHREPISAGKELKVDLVMEGKALVSADRIRVTVQLFSVASGLPVWAEKFDEKFEDIFTLLDRSSEQVVKALAQNLTTDERRLLAKRYTVSAEAYQEYIRGRYQWSKWTEEGFLKSIRNFERATELDPSSALPFAGLADAHVAMAYYDHVSPLGSFPQAKLAVQRALEIDDSLAEAQLSSASVSFFYDWDWLETERALKRAIEMNPSYSTAHQTYGLYLSAMGRFDESFEKLQRASEIDPASPLVNTTLGFPLYFAGKLEEASEIYERVLEMEPNFGAAHLALGDAYAQRMDPRAIDECEKAVSLLGNNLSMASLGYARARLGDESGALEILETLNNLSRFKYVSGVAIATVYTGLGRIEEAFESLERAYETRASRSVYIGVNPVFDPIRSDQRFLDLLARMNLPTRSRQLGSIQMNNAGGAGFQI